MHGQIWPWLMARWSGRPLDDASQPQVAGSGCAGHLKEEGEVVEFGGDFDGEDGDDGCGRL